MSKMTKRERVLRTIRFEETDRVPTYDILENDAVIEHYAGQPLTVENGTRVKGLAIGRVLDMTRMPYGPHAPGENRDARGFLIHQERWTGWIVERPFDDMPSLIEWVKKDIQNVEAQVYDDAYVERTHQEIRHCLANFAAGDPDGDPTVLVLETGAGLTEMYWATGMEWFSYLMADQPGLVEEWLQARNRAELRRVAAIADPELLPVVLTYDDIAYKNGTLFSPAWLRAHWIPCLKRLVDAWHARDTYCLFHSDGDLWAILDDLVEAGIDGLNPLEVLAGMTVDKVRPKYPGLFLTGGVDVSQLLPLGTPEEVRQVCIQNILDADGRGYFLGSSTELHWGVKLENAIAMYETPREMVAQ
jgi:uroporphyrinogen decarboxylase